MGQQTSSHPAPTQSTREGCCTTLPEISTEAIEDEVDVFSALANATRLGAIRLLVAADEEVCACDLAPPLNVSQSAISHALSRLYEDGLVERRKQGRWRYYRATPLAEELVDVFDDRQEGQ